MTEKENQMDHRFWQRYKRHHLGECRSRVCYQCKNNCPQLQNPEAKKESPMVPARVFALTQADAEVGLSTVTGEISIGGIMFTILIDSGATHSYISSRIIEKLSRPCDIMSSGFCTLLPTREVVISRRWIRSLPVLVEGIELSVDLIELDLEDFDAILGMDWLTKYNATIDFKIKMVTFEPEGEIPFIFMGKVQGSRIPLISALRTRELLREGCMGYPASVLDTTKDTLEGPEKVRVVCEFPDVFPEELLGLPPKREIDFEIELVPGAEPVSKAPCRMAPAKLKEL
ncbi:hypothetical protein CsatB_009374 [Cannabis sativa]|uniref:uncharacterized protein LOC133035352 n=1 Tax=Cannabis sativa TaxID=3483 RepID=UPI0029CA14E8|nr:uncharacterized protein LOC133035352 [Cannabis sativa]